MNKIIEQTILIPIEKIVDNPYQHRYQEDPAAVEEIAISIFRTSYLKPLKARAEVIRAMDKFALRQWPNLLQPALFDLDELTRVLE